MKGRLDISGEDRKCYKVLGVSAGRHIGLVELYSPYYWMDYNVGETMFAQGHGNITLDKTGVSLDGGYLHTFKSLKDAYYGVAMSPCNKSVIAECTIPAGVDTYSGDWDGSGDECYASKCLRVERLIPWSEIDDDCGRWYSPETSEGIKEKYCQESCVFTEEKRGS